MLFSVIIPVYNCKNSLKNTVYSVLNSGLFDFEILIIDDGSTDGTSEICDFMEKKFDNIYCIHQKNSGVSAARNCGIKTVQGEYILFIDADDTVNEGMLKNAAEIVQKTTPDMLLFGLSFDYYFHEKLYRRDELVYSQEGILNRAQWSSKFMELYNCNAISPVWNKFIRRDILIEKRIQFHENLIEMEDFLFVIQCFKYCDNIYVLPEVIYRYRQSEDEKNTYNRLIKISSLSDYMKPFEEEVRELMKKNVAEDIVNQIYKTLFYEQIRFGDITEIERAAKDMLSGKYAEIIKLSEPNLFRLLIEKKYWQIWFYNMKMRLRHWFAVRVKYIKSFGGLK